MRTGSALDKSQFTGQRLPESIHHPKNSFRFFREDAGEAFARRAYEYYHDELKKESREAPGQKETT